MSLEVATTLGFQRFRSPRQNVVRATHRIQSRRAFFFKNFLVRYLR